NFKDYVCILFDGDTLVIRWNQHGPRKYTYEVKVEAGKDYPFQVDYAQTTGLALLEMDVYHQGDMNMDLMMRQCNEADVVVFVGGISPRLEGEEMKVNAPGFKGGDRTSIELPQVQRDMMARLHQMGKRVVFVNCSGSAIALVPESQNCNAIVQAWYGGESGGTALADVLFGDYNPSGKLPITFYRSTDDLPDFLDYSMKNRTYRYFKGSPLFAFGHGLSYTTFSLGKAKYNKRRGTLTVPVTNTGTRAGSEVVQLYMRCLDDAEGPQKSLRGFARVQLQPGETKTVTIDVPASTFERFDPATNTVRLVPGRYELLYGTSSADANLQAVSVKRK
ncbi:MAG: glycoside hydrolase family 3 C-terminal domain-containing protein, partial [Bacteroidaceae bacterium]|nr:glycoside hydrolase family 3 C-terminal domain-containing protein [Bacteroidaceae bacterium]